MNKYQESLKFIVENSCPRKTYCKKCDFEKYCNSLVKQHIDDLQELVDKETPKKLIKEEILIDYDEFDDVKSFYNQIASCPNCKELLFDENDQIDFRELSYCPYCGQKLDWSEEK